VSGAGKHCFVAGAYGFIGRHVVAALLADGWKVTGGGRDLKRARALMPAIDWVAVDFNRDTDAKVWQRRLKGCDVVFNCVGVLQSGFRDRSRRIHVDATRAMFRGAAAAGVGRIVHMSALGADSRGKTAFARDKAAADAALTKIDIDAVILRPSLVYARDSYGGTAMMRALAGPPGLILIPAGAIAFEPIHADDLGKVVVRCLDSRVPGRRMYEVGGPETLSLRAIVAEMRAWLGFPPARFVSVPTVLMRPLLWLGDIAGWLGNPNAFRSTTLTQALAMPRARSDAIIQATGMTPRPMREALAAEPAAAQDRLHARLGFAGPALRIALGLFWIVSGLTVVIPTSFTAARTIAEGAGVPAQWSGWAVAIGAAIDVLLGLPMLIGIRVRAAALLQVALALVYVIALSALVPVLWLDPLGALAKALPVIFAALAVAAMTEDR
jgi:uncharacterized protein YbjT (DUF2867 family)/uncharacterized membrane protein YphA (DoxX/SURF4 family)